MEKLSRVVSPAFPYLEELCAAAINKNSRPAEIVQEIHAEGITSFNELFPEFRRRAGIYGYGDSQVRRLLTEPPAAAGV
jgi:hypothetical protein